MQRSGNLVALGGAAVLAITSFLPYWATLKPEQSQSLVAVAEPSGFSVWEAYPVPVLLGIALSFLSVGVALVRTMSTIRFDPPIRVHLVGGVVILGLLIYGLYQGPARLFGTPALFERVGPPGNEAVSFSLERGPLLYLGLVAAVLIVVGGLLDPKPRGRHLDGDTDV